jgi:methionyl-tRNA formyltransferase
MRIVFFGTPEFAVPSLKALIGSKHEVAAVVAQPDRPAGRGMRVHSPPTVAVAHQHRLPVLQPAKIREPEFLDQIGKYAPEAGVVIAYGRILPDGLLRIPTHGFINVHGSLLPKYRGAAPIQRAIEQGEAETGISIMKVDSELDHGPMLSTVKTTIGAKERAVALSHRLAEIGAQELLRVLDHLESIKPVEQDHRAATVAPKIQKEEGRVDWNIDARTLFNRFRAFDPWPGLFTSIRDEVVKLTEVTPLDGNAHPGVIQKISEHGIDVGTRRGVLRISEIQRPGKRPIPAGELARSWGLKQGERLE